MNILNTSEYFLQGINSGQIQVSGPTPTCWADWVPGESFGGRKESQGVQRWVFDRLAKGYEDARGKMFNQKVLQSFHGGNRTLGRLMGLIISRWIVGISQNWEHKVHDFKLTNCSWPSCHSMAAAGWANVFRPSRIFFGQPNPMVIMMLIYMVMNNL